MTWSWNEFWEFMTLGALLGSAVFGFMVGAFYGYDLEPNHPVFFPLELWSVGAGFIVFFTLNGMLDGTLRLEPQVARLVLWSVLCLAMPFGRRLRRRLQLRAVAHRLSELSHKRGAPNGR